MIQCTQCGTQNRDGSKFCSDCGARLVQQSGLVCPMCSTPNTVENVFCSKCGARLVPLSVAPTAEKTPPPAPIKGLSLPAKSAEPAAPAAKEEPKPAPVDETQSGDWLARLRAITPEEETPEQPITAPSPEPTAPMREPAPASEETPTWLARLRTAPPVEEAAPTEPTPPRAEAPEIAEEDLPDWLRSTPAPPAQPAAPVPAEETPSWMARSRGEPERGETASPAVSKDEIPDWLRDSSAAPTTEPAAPTVEEPDWFKPVTNVPQVPPPVPATEAGMPDWLKSLKPKEEETPAPVETAPGGVVSPGEELLESLEAAAPTALPTEAETLAWFSETPRAEVSEEEYLPDWLRTPPPGETGAAPVETPAEVAPAVEPTAQVPEWIAALKPVEQPVPGAFEGGPVETSGPLAGLRGVLPLATAIIEPHAPPKPVPPSPFKKTAHIFESILTAPAIAPTVPAAKPKRRAWTMRPLIYLLMVLAVLIPFFVPDIASSSLRTYGTPAADFYDAIQTLPPNVLVVLSFDYDPGGAGEMDLQASALVRHLMQRRAKIAAISTLEVGPQIAQRVLDNAARAAGNYAYGTNYLNLGYVPGQEAGLAQLATAGFAPTTRDFSRNQTLDKYPEFGNIRNWRNVALLIELAGSAEPLQKWMEQVQPRAGVKIAAGVSASVEPRARMYRDARQLTGFVSGLIGAAQYEILSNQRGLAVISAGAQSLAQLVLVGIILLGNLVYWVSRGRGKAK